MQRLQTVAQHLQSPAVMTTKSPITTHVLDTSRGRPAAHVPVSLFRQVSGGSWTQIGAGHTNSDGRCPTLMSEPLTAGRYRIDFDTETYFKSVVTVGFFPLVQIVFDIHNTTEHYHVPLLLSDFSYSTYRGS